MRLSWTSLMTDMQGWPANRAPGFATSSRPNAPKFTFGNFKVPWFPVPYTLMPEQCYSITRFRHSRNIIVHKMQRSCCLLRVMLIGDGGKWTVTARPKPKSSSILLATQLPQVAPMLATPYTLRPQTKLSSYAHGNCAVYLPLWWYPIIPTCRNGVAYFLNTVRYLSRQWTRK